MFSPLEICISIANAANAAIAQKLPALRTWPVVDKSMDTQAGIALMIAELAQRAFASIAINCSIPAENFGERVIEVQVSSTEWGEDEIEGLKNPEIPAFLAERTRELGNATISFATCYRVDPHTTRVVCRKSLQVMFRSAQGEVDLNQDEAIDEKVIAFEVSTDLTKLYNLRQELCQL